MMNIAPVKPQTHTNEPNTNPNPPRETMSCRHRWIPEGVEPLPDVFTGVVIYFHCIEETQKQHLSRYLIAYPYYNVIHVHLLIVCASITCTTLYGP